MPSHSSLENRCLRHKHCGCVAGECCLRCRLRFCRYDLNLTQAVAGRRPQVIDLHNQGMKVPEIAAALGLRRRVVEYDIRVHRKLS